MPIILPLTIKNVVLLSLSVFYLIAASQFYSRYGLLLVNLGEDEAENLSFHSVI